jgi:pimeloyl-ACP methyl ester carboxylesterase
MTATTSLGTQAPEARPGPTPSGPIARVVAASMAVGLLSALLVTLVLLAGAEESTILAGALLSFAAGWALLAGLSRRWTNQPQTWAFVPAGTMAATAALLLAFSPGDAVLTDLGWVWPPALLVLAVWTQRRAGEQLPRRARTWLVYPVLGFLTLSAVGGGYETVRLHADQRSIDAPGRMVDIGGRSLHLHCTGSGSPTVVLSSGLGEHSTSWAWIRDDVARTTTVCAYDRAGQGWSDDGTATPDGDQISSDLHAVLTRAGVPGPYVIAGHSTGGLYAQVFAARYPEDVAGVVLLDSLTPRAMTALPSYPGFYNTFRRVYPLLPSLARIGVGQLGMYQAGSSLPRTDRRAEHAFATTPRDQRVQRAEFLALRATFDQAQELRTLGATPLAVLTAGKGMQAGWQSEQLRMSRLSTNSAQRTAPVTHDSMISERRDAEVSAQAIDAVVQAARTHSRVQL